MNSTDWKTDISKRIVIDSGSNTLRFGTCISTEPQTTIPNLLAIDKKSGQLLCGQNLQNTLQESNLNYIKPQVRGVIVDWDNEVHLWEQMLSSYEQRDISQMCLTQTFQPGIPQKVRLRMFEVAFEYFNFDAFFPAHSQNMVRECFLAQQFDEEEDQGQELQNNNKFSNNFQLVVESSHSATYITPFFDGEPINYAVTRLDVGGRLLTSYFKDLISLRHFDFKNELRLTQQIKEEVCFVSEQFTQDMKKKKGTHSNYFILPDYDTGKKGYTTDEVDKNTYEQFLELDKERFQIPEVIFNPSDIGLFQNGLSQSILDTVKKIHPDIRDYFLENIVISGGNSQIKGFAQRLQNDIRANTPDHLDIKVHQIKDKEPVFAGCVEFCSEQDFYTTVIRKSDYRENGFHYLEKLYFQ